MRPRAHTRTKHDNTHRPRFGARTHAVIDVDRYHTRGGKAHSGQRTAMHGSQFSLSLSSRKPACRRQVLTAWANWDARGKARRCSALGVPPAFPPTHGSGARSRCGASSAASQMRADNPKERSHSLLGSLSSPRQGPRFRRCVAACGPGRHRMCRRRGRRAGSSSPPTHIVRSKRGVGVSVRSLERAERNVAVKESEACGYAMGTQAP